MLSKTLLLASTLKVSEGVVFPLNRVSHPPPAGSHDGPRPPMGSHDGPHPPMGSHDGPHPPMGSHDGPHPPMGSHDGPHPPMGSHDGPHDMPPMGSHDDEPPMGSHHDGPEPPMPPYDGEGSTTELLSVSHKKKSLFAMTARLDPDSYAEHVEGKEQAGFLQTCNTHCPDHNEDGAPSAEDCSTEICPALWECVEVDGKAGPFDKMMDCIGSLEGEDDTEVEEEFEEEDGPVGSEGEHEPLGSEGENPPVPSGSTFVEGPGSKPLPKGKAPPK